MSESNKENESTDFNTIRVKSVKFLVPFYEMAFFEISIGKEKDIIVSGIRVEYENGSLTIDFPRNPVSEQLFVSISGDVLWGIKQCVADWLCDNAAFKRILLQNAGKHDVPDC